MSEMTVTEFFKSVVGEMVKHERNTIGVDVADPEGGYSAKFSITLLDFTEKGDTNDGSV